MLFNLAKMAKIHKFGLANSLLDSPMPTWLTLTGTLDLFKDVREQTYKTMKGMYHHIYLLGKGHMWFNSKRQWTLNAKVLS